jgi:hypothetical protein
MPDMWAGGGQNIKKKTQTTIYLINQNGHTQKQPEVMRDRAARDYYLSICSRSSLSKENREKQGRKISSECCLQGQGERLQIRPRT